MKSTEARAVSLLLGSIDLMYRLAGSEDVSRSLAVDSARPKVL